MQSEFSEPDLKLIAARASTVAERIEATRDADEPDQKPHELVEQWIRAYSNGDRSAFERRLSRDGWTLLEVERALDPGLIVAALPESPWLETLRCAGGLFAAVAAEVAQKGAVGEEAELDPDRRLPFLELCSPFLRVGCELLETGSAQALERLEPAARAALDRQLLQDLSALSSPALFKEFSAFRAGQERRSKAGARRSGVPRGLYRTFVERMLGGGLVYFFREYSVLGRQLCRMVSCWVGSTEDLLRRLDSDWSNLGEALSKEERPGSVIDLECGLSDRHRGGRQVVALLFDSGIRLIYKPRSVALEAAYNRLLEWAAVRGLNPSPRPLRILDGDEYGWVEYVEQAPVADGVQAAEYYRRAGSLLCFSYVLRGDDLIAENVVATSEGPVVIDAEGFAQASIGPPRAPGTQGSDRNVLRSQLLSSIQMDPSGALYDCGGLAGRGGYIADIKRGYWRFCNTDAMFREHRVARTAAAANTMSLDGRVGGPEEYPDEILEGFENTYRFLWSHSEELLRKGGPLSWLDGCPTRTLIRASSDYGVLQHRLNQPRYQRVGTLRSFLIDALNRGFSSLEEMPAVWPLVQQERRELEGLDIPYFALATNSKSPISDGGESIEGYFSASGLDSVRRQVEELSEEDLSAQAQSLREVLSELKEPPSMEVWESVRPSGIRGEQRALFLAKALEIGESLRDRSDGENDPGSTAWLMPDFARGQSLSLNLYDGACGIGIFLATLADASGEDYYRDLAHAAYSPVVAALEDREMKMRLAQGGLGACSGVGGMIYSLVLAARQLEDRRYLVLAEAAAGLIDREAIAREERADVADGLAGTVLGVAALHDHSPSEDSLDLLRRCCDRLRALKLSGTHDELEGWLVQGQLYPGLAHGAAGIGYALARVYQVTGDGALLDEAAAAFDIAQDLFRTLFIERQNPLPLTWCHGVPGLALARLGCWDVLGSDEALREVDMIARNLLRLPFSNSDHLCCGNLSRTEFLVEASIVLGQSDLLRAAEELLGRTVQIADENKAFRLSEEEGGSVYDPGFFRGLSGIGYTLLRYSRPGVYPSVTGFRRIP